MTFLIAIGGSTGTGKTTLAYAMRQGFAPLADCLIVEDDQMRRELLVRTLRDKPNPEDYGQDVSRMVREKLDDKIKEALTKGRSVIDSSGFFKNETRKNIENLAQECGVSFVGIWLVAPRAVTEARIRKRLEERESGSDLSAEQGHASDACLGVIEKFGDIGAPTSGAWLMIDADGTPEEILEKVKGRLVS